MKIQIVFFLTLLFSSFFSNAQNIGASREYIKALTADWKGERFPDGRPKVPDGILERLKNITLEEAWAELIELGYHNQFEGDWQLIDEMEESTMTGRAVTAQFGIAPQRV